MMNEHSFILHNLPQVGKRFPAAGWGPPPGIASVESK
jgi:hypothetical protein